MTENTVIQDLQVRLDEVEYSIYACGYTESIAATTGKLVLITTTETRVGIIVKYGEDMQVVAAKAYTASTAPYMAQTVSACSLEPEYGAYLAAAFGASTLKSLAIIETSGMSVERHFYFRNINDRVTDNLAFTIY